MLKRFTFIACLMLLICSCGKPSPSATPLATIPPAASLNSVATQTEATLIPTVMATTSASAALPSAAGFSPHGPFLAFQDNSTQPSKITLFDPIQSAELVISKPAGEILQWDASGLSPDGQYLAFYTGHLDALTDLSAAPAIPQRIELNIMRTEDGSIVFQKSLLNKAYPQNFLQAADGIIANPPAGFELAGNSRDGLALGLQAAFSAFIYSNSWSPDGGVLAFASGSDGTSSDVYTYHLDSGAVARITDGPSEVYKLRWSPDGKWILNSGIYWVGEGMCGTWYLSAADGSGSSGFSIKGAVDNSVVAGCNFGEWVSDHQAFLFEDANGRGIFNLEVMDLHQKTIALVWSHTFHSFAFDPTTQQAYISTIGETQKDGTYFQQGTYQVDAATHKSVSIAPDMGSLTYLGWGAGEAIAGVSLDSGNICFFPSGSCSGFPDSGQKQLSGLSISPNRNNLVYYSDSGLWHIFPESSNQAVTRDYTGPVGSMRWSPNPDANPANDIALFEPVSQSSPYYLYYPGRRSVDLLSSFSGTDFQGWYWRR